MTPAHTDSHDGLLSRSDAFRDAALRSEERRAYAVLGVVAIIVAPLTILGASRPVEPNLLIIGVIAGAALVAIQVLTIAATRWARRAHPSRTMSPWSPSGGSARYDGPGRAIHE